jgi:glycosyltransferase involved in cell wall biosynthesis
VTQPLVSIIIPTYNRAHLIGETLDSVLAQTYTNWECIVVDDDSTDNTNEVLQAYCNKDDRFKYFKRPDQKSKGANACRNYGFELSKGEYIQWFDSDDVMLNDLLSLKINLFLQNPNVGFVVCGFRIIYCNGKQYIHDVKQSDNYFLSYISDELRLNSQNMLWKKNGVESVKWDESINKFQDLDFIFKTLRTNSLIGASVEKVLVEVRLLGDNISTNQNSNINKDRITVRKRMYLYARQSYDKNIALRFYHLYLFEIKNILSSKNYYLSLKELFTSKIIPLNNKSVMIVYTFIYMVFGRGLNKFVFYLNKIST